MSFPDMVDSMGSAGQTGGDNTPTKEELTKFKTQQAKYAEDRRKFIEAKYKDFKNGHNYFKRVLAGNIHSADWKGIFEFANSLNNIFKLDESLKSVVTLSGWFSRPDSGHSGSHRCSCRNKRNTRCRVASDTGSR